MSKQRTGRLAILALTLTLAGCYRPSSEAIEPTPTLVETLVMPTPAPALTINANPDRTQEAGAPANTQAPTTLPSNASGTAFPPITIIPATSRVAPESTNDADTTPSGTFITPGVPLPITPEAPTTPRPTVSADETEDASGLDETEPEDVETGFVDRGNDECVYIVESGDTLYSIAIDNGFTLEELRDANPELTGESPILYPEDELSLPDCDVDTTEDDPEPTPSELDATAVSGDYEIYVVQSGDTLSRIASRFGVTMDDIMQANQLTDPDRLALGQELIIPNTDE